MNESRTRVVGDTVVEGRLLSVMLAPVRQIELAGQARTTAIWKPQSRAGLRYGANLAGDDQADRRAHGGPDKAVYAYAREDYAWWSASLIERSIPACSGRTSPPKGST